MSCLFTPPPSRARACLSSLASTNTHNTANKQDGSGKSKCFGFINFSEPEAASKAVEELTGREVAGKSLYAGRAQKKAEREAMLRSQFEEKRAERVQKYQVGC